MSRRVRPRAVVGALLLDALVVIAFAAIGRASHAEGLDLGGVWGTAWPFLAALGVGWLAARAWRHPAAIWPTGVLVWVITLVAGMLLRIADGHGAAAAFIVVAALTLGLFLIGWRVIATLVSRRRRVRVDTQAS
ncbi:MAG: DUF3054 domain-containing protein [Actinomycetota bacterium]|nr:DUF3054 domain-containing protein [Actinomycetota bacterium]